MSLMSDGQREAIEFLASPATHGLGAGATVTRIDTHGAVVLLAGPRAYKIKRAVRLPYLDYSTLGRRKAALEAELTLNRRTAPELYLDVVAVTCGPDGQLALGGSGAAVEYALVMRRFDETATFDRLADDGRLEPRHLLALADAIVAFQVRLRPAGTSVDAASAMRRVVANLAFSLERHAGRRPLAGAERFRPAALAEVDRIAGLLRQRAEAGLVRRCHGDLHLGNVALIDGRPVLFDCIEFDERIATIDVLYDLAFLLMDLEHRGRRDGANLVLNRVLERSTDEAALQGLATLPLFLACRAAVRAVVLLDQLALAPAGDSSALEAEASRFLGEALACLAPPPPRLVAVGGLSGTGKSTLARALAPRLGPSPGAVHLRSDVERKRMLGQSPTERLGPEAYAEPVTERVYARLAQKTRLVLAAGHAVVVDAVFARPEQRHGIEAVASAAGAPFQGLWLEAGAEVLIDRVAARRGDASDATPEVVRSQLGYATGPIAWARVAAGGLADATVRTALDVLAEDRSPAA